MNDKMQDLDKAAKSLPPTLDAAAIEVFLGFFFVFFSHVADVHS